MCGFSSRRRAQSTISFRFLVILFARVTLNVDHYEKIQLHSRTCKIRDIDVEMNADTYSAINKNRPFSNTVATG